MKIAFFFTGTGGDSLEEYFEVLQMSPDVIRVYVQGCEHACVGDGYLFPDLTIAAKNIVDAFCPRDDSPFSTTGKLDLDKLVKNFGGLQGAISIKGSRAIANIHAVPITITSMMLCGTSRGAVTTFIVAKALDRNHNTVGIPVDIIANQPVPGRHIWHSAAAVSAAMDCRLRSNIRNVLVLLGSYHRNNGFIQNYWFAQMLPSFYEDTKVKVIELPLANHFTDGGVSNLYSSLYLQVWGYLAHGNNQSIQLFKRNIIDHYQRKLGYEFVPEDKKQKIFRLAENKTPISPDENFYVARKKRIEALLNDLSGSSLLIESVFSCAQKRKMISDMLGMVEDIGSALIQRKPESEQYNFSECFCQYRREVLGAAIKYLAEEKPTPETGVTLGLVFKSAEKNFCARVLDKDSNKIARVAMRILTNGMFLLCTGVVFGLGYNVANNWHRETWAESCFPLYSRTRSSTLAMKSTRQLQRTLGILT